MFALIRYRTEPKKFKNEVISICENLDKDEYIELSNYAMAQIEPNVAIYTDSNS